MAAHHWQRTIFEAYRERKKCWYVKQLAKTCELFSLLLSFLSLQPFLTKFLVGKYAHHKKCTSVSNYWDMSVFSPQKTFADYKIRAKWYKSAEMLITAHSCSLWAGEKAQNILGAQEPNKTFTASTCTPHTVYISGWEYTVPAYQKWIKFPPNTYICGQNLHENAKYSTFDIFFFLLCKFTMNPNKNQSIILSQNHEINLI